MRIFSCVCVLLLFSAPFLVSSDAVQGASSYGQAGRGEQEDVSLTLVPLPAELQSECVQPHSSDGGGGHTVLVLQSGSIAVCGWNDRGQCAAPPPSHSSHPPSSSTPPTSSSCPSPLAHCVSSFSKVSLHFRVTRVSCGWQHTLFADDSGGLHAVGCNAHGQLGFGSDVAHTSRPLRVAAVPHVLDMSAVAIDGEGRLWGWGNGRHGQLGIEACPKRVLPTCVSHVPHTHIAAGAQHSIAVVRSGALVGCGANKHQQLLTARATVSKIAAWTMLGPQFAAADEGMTADSVVRLKCGFSHTVLLLGDGRVLTFGRADYGQLGAGDGAVHADPQVHTVLTEIADVAVGSEHVLAQHASGHVVAFGWNEHGNLGTGSCQNSSSAVAVPLDDRPDSLVCGGGHSLVIFNDR